MKKIQLLTSIVTVAAALTVGTVGNVAVLAQNRTLTLKKKVVNPGYVTEPFPYDNNGWHIYLVVTPNNNETHYSTTTTQHSNNSLVTITASVKSILATGIGTEYEYACFSFKEWTDANGKVLSTNPTYNFTINKDTTIIANYNLRQDTFIIYKGVGGAEILSPEWGEYAVYIMFLLCSP